MTTTNPIAQIERDAKIINALHVARYALVIHDSLPYRCEGAEFRMDFTEEIAEIDAVMTMLGVDLSEPLPAPIKEHKEND